MMAREVRIFDTPQQLFDSAASEFISLRPRTVALSGGSTPKALYSLLAARYAEKIPWSQLYFFFGDERHVPPNDQDSNYRMASEALLSKAPIPPQNIFRVPAENPDAEAAALAYEKSIRDFFGVKLEEFPRFDLILLGMGPDGHTASLFPGSKAIEEHHRIFVANWVEKFKTHRLTFTFPVLNHAANVVFMATGENKAPVMKDILENLKSTLPAAQVQPSNGRLLWLLDRAAASQLT
ncbi:MAG TPA: 6-phosphogluconolactonase [Terriglobales bacterium]|nr:6-phosphogluconolactonase [Terriglobales bacterium]